MSRKPVCIALLLVLLGSSFSLASDHSMRNTVGRFLGLGWSDGYHSKSGCPSKSNGGTVIYDGPIKPSAQFQRPEQLPTPASKARPTPPIPLRSGNSNHQ